MPSSDDRTVDHPLLPAPPNSDTTDDPPPPWDDPDFSATYRPPSAYYTHGGHTYRQDAGGGAQHICGFVPIPVGEVVVVNDIDDPEAKRSQTILVRIVTSDGASSIVAVNADGAANLSAAITQAVPSSFDRLSVTKPNEIAKAAHAFASGAFATRTVFAQTGWLPDGAFAFPGSEAVTLEKLGRTGGLGLLHVPDDPDPAKAAAGAEVLAEIVRCAPLRVTVLLVGMMAAGPMFRQALHLAARAFTMLLAGPSGYGKTTLLTRIYSLLGPFYAKPGCVATWRATMPTLEAILHDLRDLSVFVDNFRASDGNATEKFREVVISVGDGAARGLTGVNSKGRRVLPSLHPNALLLATGEHGFDDDAAVNARLIELLAQDIDKGALLSISSDKLDTLPHFFSAFVHHLGAQEQSYWSNARAFMKKLATELTDRADARTSEHLATVLAGFAALLQFIELTYPQASPQWQEIATAFKPQVEDIAQVQAGRVRNDRIDQAVLREVARAAREGRVHLARIPGSTPCPTPRGQLLGAYDSTTLYLIPDSTTRWASDQLRSSGRRRNPVGRKELGAALAARGNHDGDRVSRTFAGARHGVWRVSRAGLDDTWDGLLDQAEPADPADAPPQSETDEP